ncbi:MULTISPECIES: DUF2179 domain-containing protein [Bacillaceae]|uniref:DUF2179 domain-containing protein n=1 Tax=Bacillaceae TaxID=186817 RepID=UPI0006AEBE32|nr:MULTISPECIES: DUF2179 domain-containing protein [Bacillaceae]ALC87875.1 hypothetical protein AM499_20295 [Bacillus sp. FJAT-22090]KQL27639.1 hypothetical protein AN959_20110 [Psychrobacillus sp. FJAT-21963]MDF2068525.1 DUF2179 domain-containing protein [Bacillus sp. Cr_A10]
MTSTAISMVLIIFAINIVYVTLSTTRMILTLKGYRYVAALISIIEVVVYIVGLGLVLDNLNEIHNLIAYALGFGTGIVVGSKLEEKMSLGYIMVNAISTESESEINLSTLLREEGYGVTSWTANGLEGARQALQILTPRKDEAKLYNRLKEIDPKIFIIAYEPKTIHGGFWVKRVRRGKLFS